MIEEIVVIIVKELGPVGLLVVGLYLVLARPLRAMAYSLSVINHEIGEIIKIIKDEKWQK